MAPDVPTTRDACSSLSDGWTYLNMDQRTQVPKHVQAAIISAFRNVQKSLSGETKAGAHGQSHSSGAPVAAELAASARRASMDLTDSPVAGVVLGSSREILMGQFASAMNRRLTLGPNLVIPRIGSQVVHAPPRRAVSLCGAQVRTAEADLSSGTLPSWQFDGPVDEHTRPVVILATDLFVGTIAPIVGISWRVHEHSNAWALVDALDIATHFDVSVSKLNADIMLVNAFVLDGSEVTALMFRGPEMFERMVSLSYVLNAHDAERTETFPVSLTLFDGVPESVLHLVSLDSMARGSRRHRIKTAMPRVSCYLTTLSECLIAVLMTPLRVYTIDMDTKDDSFVSMSRAQHIPCVSLLVGGVSAKVIVDRLLDNGLVTSIVDAYESSLLGATDIDEAGDAVGAGLQPFNTPHDIDQLVRAIAPLGQLGSRLTKRLAQSCH